jgi:hypothetical protein
VSAQRERFNSGKPGIPGWLHEQAGHKKSRYPRSWWLDPECLFDLVYAIAPFGLRGLDLEAVLLGGGREEARIECFCQSVAVRISARVAPLGRPISSRIFAPLLSARGAQVSLARAGFGAFLPGLASFFGKALVLLSLADFWLLDAPFFWLTPFFEEDFSGAMCAPCCATVAAFSVIIASAFAIMVNPFCAWLAHDDSSLRLPRNARELLAVPTINLQEANGLR